MLVFFLPSFIADLRQHKAPLFARKVLRKTLSHNGKFIKDNNDHRYKGINSAWIRYVTRGKTAYRVIYLQKKDKIYLYRAGRHDVEDGLTAPVSEIFENAIPIKKSGLKEWVDLSAFQRTHTATPTFNRFRRNLPQPQIYREIFSRRNLPHKEICLVAPLIDPKLFTPTASFGKLLHDQVDDGANVTIITTPPKDKKIKWMENLVERDIEVFVYPRLHAKLFCFFFDENREHVPSLQDVKNKSSLILLGSADLTNAGINSGDGNCNEELCYVVPENEIGFVEEYILELMNQAYELQYARDYFDEWTVAQTGE